MKYLCIAASNSRKPVEESVSYRVCEAAKSLIEREDDAAQREVTCVSLKSFDFNPCTLCGTCAETGLCPQDSEFNRMLSAIISADRLLFVVPHYSPLPSKLMILFEKLNEQAYAGWLKNPDYQSPVQGKKFAVIGHGGMTETPAVLKYYHETLVMPVARTLKSLGMTEAVDHQQGSQMTVFGLLNDECLQTNDGQLFPDILLDVPRITKRIEPLIQQFANSEEA